MNIYNALGFDGKPTTRSFDAGTGVWSDVKAPPKPEPQVIGGVANTHPTLTRESNLREDSRMMAAMEQARIEAEKAGPEMQEAGVRLRSKSYPRALAELKAENLRLTARLARIEAMLSSGDWLEG